jgi:hypothetical protein
VQELRGLREALGLGGAIEWVVVSEAEWQEESGVPDAKVFGGF